MKSVQCLCFLIVLLSGSEGWFFPRNGSTTNAVPTTTTPSITNVTQLLRDHQPHNEEEIDPVEAEAGAIVGAVFGILVSMGFIAFAGVMYLRRKRERDVEYNRQAKVHKMSTQSAGVYRDTTTDTRYMPKSAGQTEYTSLRKDPNIYEDDSEDEL